MARPALTALLVMIAALASCVVSFKGLVGGEPADNGVDDAGTDGVVTEGKLPPTADGSTPDTTQPSDATKTETGSETGAGTDTGVLPDDAPPTGNFNLYLLAAYEGGPFTINVDVDKPDIVIGLVAAEPLTVTITGTYADRVKAVHFAGRAAAAAGTQVNGVSPGIVTIASQPAASADGRGAATIQCQYEGGARYNDANCNTREQIENYFHSKFPGAIVVHGCRYGAYSGTVALSAGATCDCTPTTCADEGKACDPYPDGCGGPMLNCGTCTIGTCGGFGVANQCGGCSAGQTTAGPRLSQTAADVNSAGSAVWTNLLAVGASDNVRSNVTLFPNYPSTHWLRATKFGFSVPSATTIKGVYLEVEASNDMPFDSFRDAAVSLVVDLSTSGTDHKQAAPWAPSDLILVPKDHVRVYGGPTDTWGLTLTDAQVNSDDFGAGLRVLYNSASGSGRVGVDAMRMWLCY